jgi:hypothetical protein
MSHEAFIVCVAESKVSSAIAALTAAMRYPLVEMAPAEAGSKIVAAQPAAVIVPGPRIAPDLVATILSQVATIEGPYVPVLAGPEAGGIASVLPIPRDPPPARMVARLAAALRVRALHSTVLRRAAAQGKADTVPRYDSTDSLDQATVLVAGRGGGYPALAMAVGERVGLIGALGFDTAERYLEGRDIDGIVVGDGFSARAVETFLDLLRADARFRDLPVVVADSRIGELDFDALPNADRVRGGPEHVLAHLLPLVHLHAFAASLRRCTRALETKGSIDPETGLLTCDAFIHDLTHAVADAKKRKASLSLARFFFARIERRASIDAARIVSRLVRTADFACQDDDGSIHVAFGDTDLKGAHVVARRIASVLKHTMLAPGPEAARLDPEVALVTRRAADTAATLLARVRPAPIAAA